jgi:hypothetical protein
VPFGSAGCTNPLQHPGVSGRSGVVDERAGTFGGVRLGAPARSLARLGRHGDGPGLFPLGTGPGLPAPNEIPAPNGVQDTGVFAYRGFSVLIGADRVYGFVVATGGSRTCAITVTSTRPG